MVEILNVSSKDKSGNRSMTKSHTRIRQMFFVTVQHIATLLLNYPITEIDEIFN